MKHQRLQPIGPKFIDTLERLDPGQPSKFEMIVLGVNAIAVVVDVSPISCSSPFRMPFPQ